MIGKSVTLTGLIKPFDSKWISLDNSEFIKMNMNLT